MNITPIPDKDAAKLLGVHHMTIRGAVKRGDLIRVPAVGTKQCVAKEQIMLFQNKKILREKLNSEERATWEAIEADILGKQPASSYSIQATNVQATSAEAKDSPQSILQRMLEPAMIERLSEPNIENGFNKFLDMLDVLGKPSEQHKAEQKNEHTPNFQMRQVQEMAGLAQ